MKILAVGMNYPAHINELDRIWSPLDNNSEENSFLNKVPVIFSKPDSAIIQPGKPFFVPDFAERFDYETEIVVKVSRVGKDISERFAHRYYEEVTIGIDFTARDLQKQLQAKGLPWEICKGFDGSAGVGKFMKKEELGDLQNLEFHMDMNGMRKQEGNTKDMIHGIDKIVSYASRFFTLKTGDLIFTGTPVGVGEVKEGDVIDGYIGENHLLHLRVK